MSSMQETDARSLGLILCLSLGSLAGSAFHPDLNALDQRQNLAIHAYQDRALEIKLKRSGEIHAYSPDATDLEK